MEIGIEIGKVEGIEIGKKEIALKLIKKGLDLEAISEITGLSVIELRNL